MSVAQAPTTANRYIVPALASERCAPSGAQNLIFDHAGRVVATEGLSASSPWVVKPSTKFPGHMFFYNSETSESTWTLKLEIFEGTDKLRENSSRIQLPKLQDGHFENTEPKTSSNLKSRRRSLNVDDLNVAEHEATTDVLPRVEKNAHLKEPPLFVNNQVPISPLPARSSYFDKANQFFKPTRSLFQKRATAPLLSRSTRRVVSEPLKPITRDSRVFSDPSKPSLRDSQAQEDDLFPAPHPDGTPTVAVLAGLGSGGFGKVMLVTTADQSIRNRWKRRTMYAMKVVSKVRQRRPKDRERMATELEVMREIEPSRFLMRCHAAFESSTDVFFVCDYLEGGDLFHHMVRRMKRGLGGLKESECRVLLAEVTCGLKHLHEQGFVHRDLKVENIMLDASGHVKIIDFGLAVKITEPLEQEMSPAGTLRCIPPELISSGQKTGGRHTDWWAMGMVAYELMAARTPWWTNLEDKPSLRQEIRHRKVPAPSGVSFQAKMLVEGLLEPDYRMRLGTISDTEVTGSSFFAGLDWEAMKRGESEPAFKPRGIGSSVVDKAEGKQALTAYFEGDLEASPGQFFWETGKFGVKSPWFLGVDVVTHQPGKF